MVNRQLFYSLAVFLLVTSGGCTRSDNVFDAPVVFSKADITFSVQGNRIQIQDSLTVGISAIQICDSVMILKTLSSGFQIHALSLYDFANLGHYISKGRGPGELITPIIKNNYRDKHGDDNIAIFDLSLCSMYYLNLSKSIREEKTVLDLYAELPPGTLDAYTCDSLIIALIPESDDYVCCIYGNAGNKIKEISLCHGLPGINYFDKLSSACTVCETKKRMVMAMCMLPQINFLNLDTEEIKTVAVRSEYRDWRDILNKSSDDQNIYYTSITQSSDRIMALYYGSSFIDWVRNVAAPHIHVYDWDGKFIYDIEIEEKLKTISFDKSSEILYGVDINDKIYKYDFSGLK